MSQADRLQATAEIERLRGLLAEREEENRLLRQNEARFRAFVENAFDAFTIIDARGAAIYESPAGIRLMGRPGPQPGVNAFQYIHPDDLPESHRILHALTTQPDARIGNIRVRARHENGEYRWLEMSACSKLHDPAVNGIVVNWRDITEQKRATDGLREVHEELERRVEMRTAELLAVNTRLSQEAAERNRAEQAARDRELELQHLVDALPMRIAFVDEQQRFRWVNHAYEIRFGLPRERIVGMTMRELLGDTLYQEVLPHFHRALAGETVNFQVVVADPQGTPRYLSVALIPYCNDALGLRGFFASVSDVSDLKQAQERVRQLQADLAHFGRLDTMGEMASGLAHELNQPLAAITSYAGAALLRLRVEGNYAPALAEMLTRISEQAQRAGEVIRRLRAFVSRAQPHRALLSVNDVVHEAVQLMDHELRHSSCRLRLELGDALPQPWGDRIQIVQVLVNLIRNAGEAMAGTPAERRMLGIQTSKDSGGVRVRVSDAGCGIAPEMVERLFFPFHTTKPEGMGMGLAISRSIIEAHSGRVWAETEPSDGAVFSFTLPAGSK